MPGDYAFPINNAICDDKELRWIGCCNELNAAYAADGYARINGMSALSDYLWSGRTISLCGIAGAYGEHTVIFHIVGIPNMQVQEKHVIVHHALGNGEFDLFMKMATPIVCAKIVLTPENCIHEVERLITAAMEYRHPVYIAIPKNHVNANVSSCPALANVHVKSDPEVLEEVVSIIINKLSNSKKACIMPGIFVDRFGLNDFTTTVINTSGLPYVTMAMDKSVIDETNPSYLGLYSGQLVNTEIRDFVESCDCILAIGTILSDINLGGVGKFTVRLEKSHIINIMPSEIISGMLITPI